MISTGEDDQGLAAKELFLRRCFSGAFHLLYPGNYGEMSESDAKRLKALKSGEALLKCPQLQNAAACQAIAT